MKTPLTQFTAVILPLLIGLHVGYGATFTVTTTNVAGAGSLRTAIVAANAAAGLDTIAFSIGGGGAQTIRPQSSLPTLPAS